MRKGLILVALISFLLVVLSYYAFGGVAKPIKVKRYVEKPIIYKPKEQKLTKKEKELLEKFGEKQKKDEEPSIDISPIPSPTISPSPSPSPSLPVKKVYPVKEKKAPKKKSPLVFIIVGVLIVMIIGVGIVFLRKREDLDDNF